MTHIQTFISEILVNRSMAAKFFRTDFHLHSPFSHDWMDKAANPLLKRNTALPIQNETVVAYHDVCLKAGVELAAITDHMRFCLYQEATRVLGQENGDILNFRK